MAITLIQYQEHSRFTNIDVTRVSIEQFMSKLEIVFPG